jgi:hypothetical protein
MENFGQVQEEVGEKGGLVADHWVWSAEYGAIEGLWAFGYPLSGCRGRTGWMRAWPQSQLGGCGR